MEKYVWSILDETLLGSFLSLATGRVSFDMSAKQAVGLVSEARMKNYIKKVSKLFIKEDLIVMGLFMLGWYVSRRNGGIRQPTVPLGTFLSYLSTGLISNVNHVLTMSKTKFVRFTTTKESCFSRAMATIGPRLMPPSCQKTNCSSSSAKKTWTSSAAASKTTDALWSRACSAGL